jgi:hypothetical protein
MSPSGKMYACRELAEFILSFDKILFISVFTCIQIYLGRLLLLRK